MPPDTGASANGLPCRSAASPTSLAVAGSIVLLSINGTPAQSVEQVREVVAKATNKSVALLIQRGEDKIFVPVRIG